MNLRFRPSGVCFQELHMLHQKDGGEVPGGSPERHPEPSPDVQLQPEVSHSAQRGRFSRWVLLSLCSVVVLVSTR